MPGSGCVCAFRIPTVHGEIGVSASNHEPVGWIRSHESTDLTPEFLQCCHGSVPHISVVSHAHSRSRLVGDVVSELLARRFVPCSQYHGGGRRGPSSTPPE